MRYWRFCNCGQNKVQRSKVKVTTKTAKKVKEYHRRLLVPVYFYRVKIIFIKRVQKCFKLVNF